jgi:RHS repeat-associated protein
VQGAGIDEPLARLTGTTPLPTAAAAYYHPDGLGSLVATTGAAGTVTATQRFEAFGGKHGGLGSIPTFGYAGREPDATGLIYHRARYHDPAQGRFLSRDPLGFVDGVNRYAYAGNDPINAVDAEGTKKKPKKAAAASVVLDVQLPPSSPTPTRNPAPDGNVEATKLAMGLIPILTKAAPKAIPAAKNGVPSPLQTALGLADLRAPWGGLSQAYRYGVKSAKALRNTQKDPGLQVHHLIEQRFAKTLRVSEDDMLSIVVTPKEHQGFTNAWRSFIGYNNDKKALITETANPEQIMDAARKVYNGYPKILKSLGLK